MQTILESGRSEKNYWKDLWRFRELFQVLAWRDISVRYKQTVIGILWAIIRPLLSTLIGTFVFGSMAGFASDVSAPYALVIFAGMLAWQFFHTALSDASNSLTTNANLISKVYFPRLIVPTASIMVALIDFAISFVLFLLMMLYFGHPPTWNILALPLFIVMGFFAVMGPSLWIASLNVKYRDFRYVIPFILQFGYFITPVLYPKFKIMEKIPEHLQILYYMNPMVGVIDGFRWCLIGSEFPLDWTAIASSIFITIFFMWLGIRQFRKMEKTFADLI